MYLIPHSFSSAKAVLFSLRPDEPEAITALPDSICFFIRRVISSLKTNFGGLFNWIKINYKQVIGLLVWVGFGAVLLGLIPSENNWNQYFMLVWIALLGLMGNYLFQKMNRPRKLEEK